MLPWRELLHNRFTAEWVLQEHVGMKQKHYAVLCLAALVGSTGFAWAQNPAPIPPPPPGTEEIEVEVLERDFEFMGPRGGGHEMRIDSWEISPRMLTRMADELQLTPAQQGKITEIMATQRPAVRKLREELRAESRQLRDIGPQDRDFDTRSKAAAARIGSLSSEMVQQGANLRKQVWAVLTPEQRGKLQARQQQMRDRMQHRRERMNDRRDNGGGRGWQIRRGMGEGGDGKRRILIRERRVETPDEPS
ncbi:MAG: hypothetical protein EBR00_10150 [Gammaproteobacteria bacterium]|nr:hypothetical protein [Gammaproteobacteria bacterium]